MGEWILTVVGIAILTILCDVILPDGQTRKYVKTVMGIIVTFVIIQPLVGLFTSPPQLDELSVNSAISSQQPFIENIETRQNEQRIIELEKTLSVSGYSVKDISASSYDKTVIVSIEDAYSFEKSAELEKIVWKFFPKYEIKFIWK